MTPLGFQFGDALQLQWLVSPVVLAPVVDLCTTPGAFVARRLIVLIPARIHTLVMKWLVVIDGLGSRWRAWR